MVAVAGDLRRCSRWPRRAGGAARSDRRSRTRCRLRSTFDEVVAETIDRRSTSPGRVAGPRGLICPTTAARLPGGRSLVARTSLRLSQAGVSHVAARSPVWPRLDNRDAAQPSSKSARWLSPGAPGTTRSCARPPSPAGERRRLVGRPRRSLRCSMRSPVWEPPRWSRSRNVFRRWRCSCFVSSSSRERAGRVGARPARHSTSSAMRLPTPASRALIHQTRLERRVGLQHGPKVAERDRHRVGTERRLVGVEHHAAEPARVVDRQPRTIGERDAETIPRRDPCARLE